MAEITIDDPDYFEKTETDKQGRLYLGKDFANKEVRVAIEVADE